MKLLTIAYMIFSKSKHGWENEGLYCGVIPTLFVFHPYMHVFICTYVIILFYALLHAFPLHLLPIHVSTMFATAYTSLFLCAGVSKLCETSLQWLRCMLRNTVILLACVTSSMCHY